MSRIVADGWGWRYAGRATWAVHDLDLTIDDGERVLLLGPSGAGKSTLLFALAGVLGGDSDGTEQGRLLIDGQHPTHRVGQVGLVQQDPASQVVLARVGDDVAFGLENMGVPRESIWPRVRASLDEVGLGNLALDHPTNELSGGQQQRLVLAGALAMQGDEGPGLLLLDEPTANLDPTGVEEVLAAVTRAVAGRSTTLVVVEHRVDVWLDLVDRIVVLGPDGGIAADGDPRMVLHQHAADLTANGVWVPGVPLPVTRRIKPGGGLDISGAVDMDVVFRAGWAAGSSQSDSYAGSGGSGGVKRRRGWCERGTTQPYDPPFGIALTGSDLTIGYRAGEPVLTGLDVTVPAGISTVITGPNGSGKSTLALTLAGLLPQLGGLVEASQAMIPQPANRRQRHLVQGLADPHTWTSRQLLTRLGTVFQEPEHQFVASSVRDELAVGLRALGQPAAAITTQVDELLSLLHLTTLADVNPFTLSGGEKRRLSVGTVLATGPSVIILDEPTFGQDRNTWCDLVLLIMGLLDEGRTVIGVTHDRAYIDVLGEHQIELDGRSKPGLL